MRFKVNTATPRDAFGASAALPSRCSALVTGMPRAIISNLLVNNVPKLAVESQYQDDFSQARLKMVAGEGG